MINRSTILPNCVKSYFFEGGWVGGWLFRKLSKGIVTNLARREKNKNNAFVEEGKKLYQ